MQKLNTRLICLFVLGVLLVGCGTPAIPSTPTSLPTLTPTATSIPPTNTPIPTDTPAPTFTPTPAPTQSLTVMIQTLSALTDGNGLAIAAAYDPGKQGVHPILIDAPANQVEGWNASLPAAWRPVNVSQVELVARLSFHNLTMGARRYFLRGSGAGGVFIRTYRVDTEVFVIEARTGKLIANTLFKGGPAPSLPDHLPAGTTGLYGTTIAYETLQLWLKSYVEK